MPGDDISSMDVKEAFYTLQTYLDEIGETNDKGEEQYTDLPEIYKKARYGIDMKFDLYDYLNNTMIIKQKTGKILYRGKIFNLSEFWTEIEERTIIMKKWLKENTPNELNIGAYTQ